MENRKTKNNNKRKKIRIVIICMIVVIIISIVGRIAIINYNTKDFNYMIGENSSSSLIADNIKKGITIGGITGTLEDLNTFDATATSEDILEGKTAYVKGEKITGTYVENVLVTEISLSNSELTLRKGEKFKLTATVIPENATNKSIIWSSSNSECASVDQEGVITAVNIGNCTITAQSADNGSIKSTCSVIVKISLPGTVEYAIIVNEMANGSVRVSQRTASKGDIVSIIVIPNDGYRLESISVLDLNGDNIEVTGDDSGVYTFVMPSSKVTVGATFVPL